MSSLCLVTGACGFIGTHMVELLHEAGYRIRATDLASAYHHDDRVAGRFPSVLKNLGVEFVPANITIKESLGPVVKGVEYVFHIAGIFNYSAPWSLLYGVNVQGTRNLLEQLTATTDLKKIVVWGAGGVYRLPRGPEDLPFRETSPIDPGSNYLKTKWQEEELVAQFCGERRLRWSSVRGTTVYGPRAVYGGGQMFLDVLKMKRALVPRNFTFKIPTVHVRDFCRAALFLAEHPETDGESYNVNDDSQTAMTDFFRMVAEAAGRPFTPLPPVPVRLFKSYLLLWATLGRWRHKIFGGKPPKFEKDSLQYFGKDFVYSNEKLKKAGFQFQYPDFRIGLKEAVAWYRENHWV